MQSIKFKHLEGLGRRLAIQIIKTHLYPFHKFVFFVKRKSCSRYDINHLFITICHTQNFSVKFCIVAKRILQECILLALSQQVHQYGLLQRFAHLFCWKILRPSCRNSLLSETISSCGVIALVALIALIALIALVVFRHHAQDSRTSIIVARHLSK